MELDDQGFESEVVLGTCIGMMRGELEATLISNGFTLDDAKWQDLLDRGLFHECSKHKGRYLSGPPGSGVFGNRITRKTQGWLQTRAQRPD